MLFQMRILIYNTIVAKTCGLLTKELINSTFQFQTCELHINILKDCTIIFEIYGLSVEDLTGNTVQDHTCG
jgi:hypothetical protein